MLSFRNSARELAHSGVDTAVISVGSTEQCGPCLPLHLDTLVAEYFASAWGEALNAYVLPTLPFNTAEEHSSFRGTITLRPQTMMQVLEEMAGVLSAQGFRKQVLTTGHGGSRWIPALVKHVNCQYEDTVLVNAHHGGARVWAQALKRAGLARSGELHRGSVSRAIALFLCPDFVADGEYGQRVPRRMEACQDYVTWDKIAPNGSWGEYTGADAAVVTAEAGRRLLEYFVERQARRLKDHLAEACRVKGI